MKPEKPEDPNPKSSPRGEIGVKGIRNKPNTALRYNAAHNLFYKEN